MNPLVCSVLLTADRPEMTARAVRCFDEQTYDERKLLIFDTGEEMHLGHRMGKAAPGVPFISPLTGSCHVWFPELRGRSIGELRNRANSYGCIWLTSTPDLFAYWDSDDWSHPMRLEEQVALIDSDAKLDAVGYSDMLFWECSPPRPDDGRVWAQLPGQAWLYTSTSNYLLGTSLLYRRSAWERKRFEHVSLGEDKRWEAGMRMARELSVPRRYPRLGPSMIASIHGANTSSRIDPAAENWRRVPEWDAHCRETMALPIATTAR